MKVKASIFPVDGSDIMGETRSRVHAVLTDGNKVIYTGDFDYDGAIIPEQGVLDAITEVFNNRAEKDDNQSSK